MNETKEKNSVFRKILRVIKKVIFKFCGKARWLLLVFAVTATVQTLLSFNEYTGNQYDYSLGDVTSAQIETPLKEVELFSVNDSGTAAICCDIGAHGLTSVMNVDDGTHSYSNTYYVVADMKKDDVFMPSDIAITDDNVLYAVRTYYENDLGKDVITKESIVRISQKYEYIDTVCDIPYDVSENIRRSKLSKLHYFDGAVTFAVIDRDKAVLYSIDTETKTLTKSRDYPTDRDGTYTVNVIPVDGAFLFVRSDGEVYSVGFDQPLEESIYRFDNTDTAPYFTQAVLSGGVLYAFDENKPEKVYKIEGGKAEMVIDTADIGGHKDSSIKYIGSYVPQDNDAEVLAVCLSDGLFTYSDGALTDKNIIVKADVVLWINILMTVTGIIMNLSTFGLVINLIIRKKTLLYKQIMVTVPVFAVITVVIAVKLYGFFEEQTTQNTRSSVEMICEFGTKEFEEYDFSGLFDVNENTGAEYGRLSDKLREINTDHTLEQRGDYVLSVVYRTSENKAALLAKSDELSMPMCSDILMNSEEDFRKYDKTGGFYTSQQINSFFSFEAKESDISAYGRIADKNGDGNIYFKVSTANRRFWDQRREFVISLIDYSMLILLLLIMIVFITSLYITGAIRKATGAVKKISDGDLSARIKYRSKDELGEICAQVNSMGQSLETLFEEKDKTERFYYKFVPEQFRELLGKERFTDLSLGDSSSRELTVLFCDIRSFSINSEMMTAKENFEFVNIIYGIAGPIIRENGGFVDKYIGDAVMALFDNADDAVRSGIEIYRAIVLDPHTAERLGVSDINIGIGIHSGMAQIGIVGEEERLSGTVISDTVNLSSRLESLTKQYKTAMLISKDTVDRMTDPDSLDLRYLGIVQVAGVNEVKAIYEVLDCLPDEERAKRHKNSRTLREAIRLFHLGRRAETEEMLRDISDSGEDDHVTKMYREFIDELSDDDKGNVFRFVRK